MEYLIGDKKVRLNLYNMKYSKEIGKGTSGSVYLIRDKAYKLYRPYCGTENMTKDIISYMSTIPTKRIVLPECLILSKKRKLCGYVSKYVEDLGSLSVLDYSKDKFIDEIKLLEEDMITLGDKKVLVNDMSIENMSFNDGMYMIDTGRFKVNKMDENLSISYNFDLLNEFLVSGLICKISGVRPNGIYNFRRELIKNISDSSLTSFLEKDMSCECVGEYIKRKVR